MSLDQRRLEDRSRALFHGSVDGVDMAMRSRLTRARHAALEAAAQRGPRGWFSRGPAWAPAAGVTAAAVLATALWFGTPLGQQGIADHRGATAAEGQSNLEDLELVASADEGSGDAMEMLQDDIDFYAWADKAAGAEPAA